MRAVKSPATYADLIALPENLVGEILDGELFASPRPAPKHAYAYSAVGGMLFNPFHRGMGGPGGWILPKYGRAGVPHAWIIDPLNRTLEPFAWRNGTWELLCYEEKGQAHVAPFDAVRLDLDALWAP